MKLDPLNIPQAQHAVHEELYVLYVFKLTDLQTFSLSTLLSPEFDFFFCACFILSRSGLSNFYKETVAGHR